MKKYKIDDLFMVIRNGANIKQDPNADGIPITRIETTSNDKFNRNKVGFANIYDSQPYKNFILQDRDLLMSHINSEKYLGRCVLYNKQDNECIIHGMNLLMLRANTNLINPRYINLYFKSTGFKSNIAKITKKSVNQASFNVNSLKNIEVNIPDLSEQEKIADKFDKLFALIEQNKTLLVKYDDLVKSQFIEMFGDPINNEKGWLKQTIKNLASKIGSGATPKGGRDSYGKDGISLIRSMNVHNGYFDYKELAHISDDQANKLNNVIIEKDDVLLNITGASVARCCIVPDNVIPARVNQHVSIIRCKKEILPIFLCSMMIDNNYQTMLWELAGSGATREAITKQQIENLQIIVPPIELQNQFADFVKHIDKLKFTLKQTLEKLENCYHSLMQEYFE